MFQSEQLQEKWAPLLDYEGLDSIKDSHRRAVTAVLLENQEKFLKEEQAFSNSGMLNEASPTNSAGPTLLVSVGSATAAGPVAGFDPVLISLIRRSMPNLVAYDLAGVQPMSGPTGLIFAMLYATPIRVALRHSMMKLTLHSLVRMMSLNLTGGMSDVNSGMGTTAQNGTNPSVLNPVGSASSIGHTVGQGMQTGDAENLGSGLVTCSTRWHSQLRKSL